MSSSDPCSKQNRGFNPLSLLSDLRWGAVRPLVTVNTVQRPVLVKLNRTNLNRSDSRTAPLVTTRTYISKPPDGVSLVIKLNSRGNYSQSKWLRWALGYLLHTHEIRGGLQGSPTLKFRTIDLFLCLFFYIYWGRFSQQLKVKYTEQIRTHDAFMKAGKLFWCTSQVTSLSSKGHIHSAVADPEKSTCPNELRGLELCALRGSSNSCIIVRWSTRTSWIHVLWKRPLGQPNQKLTII